MNDRTEPATATPSAAERMVIQWARIVGEKHRAGANRHGWKYPHPAALLVAEGRLFSPAPEPLPADRRGAVGECWFNASVHADDNAAAVYVEGWAATSPGLEEPHAWCATDDVAIEPTAGCSGNVIYLGIPFTADFRHRLYRRHGVGTILWNWEVAREFLQHGLPPDSVARGIGRPLPPAKDTEPN